MVSMLPTFALAFFFPALLLFVPVRFLLYIPYSPVASCNGLGITRRQEGVDECAVIRRGGSRAAIVRSMISRKQVLQVYHREKREKRELDFVHRSPFSGIIGFLRSGNAYSMRDHSRSSCCTFVGWQTQYNVPGIRLFCAAYAHGHAPLFRARSLVKRHSSALWFFTYLCVCVKGSFILYILGAKGGPCAP